MEYIKMEDLKRGYLYHIKARNSYVGIWIPERKSFLISRWKFGANYLFEEYHWDIGEPYGTVKPLEEIAECYVTLPDTLRYSEYGFEQEMLSFLNKKNDPYENKDVLYPHGRPEKDFKSKK